jgi:sec-independent protein translocase protein TatA
MNVGDLFDSPWKVLIIAVVVLVLFGSKKMPDAARSLGRSMRILKAEVSNLHPDDEEEQVKQAQFQQPQPLPAVSQQAQIDALQQQIRDLQQQQQPQPVVNGSQATDAPRTQQAG